MIMQSVNSQSRNASELVTSRSAQVYANLLSALWRGGNWGMLWTPEGGETHDKKRSTWLPVDKAWMPAAWANNNVYFGVNPATVRREVYQATTNDTIAVVNALYAEWDGKDFTDPSEDEVNDAYDKLRANADYATVPDDKLYEQAKDMAGNARFLTDIDGYKEAALAHIESLPVAPSCLWDSGGGYQGVWLLDETVKLDSDATRERMAAIQKAWATFVGADRGVCDLRRVLRLPGTVNHKPKYAPNYPVVSFLYENYDRRYSLDTLSGLLDYAEPVDTEAFGEDGDAPLISTDDRDLIISTFNRLMSVRKLLLDYGYTEGDGRMSRPGDKDSKGVIVHANNTSVHWSSHDPLYSEHARTPFDVWSYYACDGNDQDAYRTLRTALYASVRLWMRTTSFAELIPAERQPSAYRTDSTDTKVADAVLDMMEKAGKVGVSTGKKRLGKLAGVAPNTALSALLRLGGWLFDIEPTDKGGVYVRFSTEFQAATLAPMLVKIVKAGSESVANEYSTRKADEPFLSGTSQYIKRQAKAMAIEQGNETGTDVPYRDILYSRFYRSIGETGLRILDALIRCGDMTVVEMAEETSKKVSSLRSGLKRLELYGLVAAERENAREPKVYGLTDNVWAKLETLAPEMRTWTLQSQREDARLKDAQRWVIQELPKATEYEKPKLERRISQLAAERVPHLARMFADLGLSDNALRDLAEDEGRMARTYGVRQPLGMHPAKEARLARRHGEAALEVSAQRQREAKEREAAMMETAAQLRNQGVRRFEWYGKFVLAGYTNNEVKSFMASTAFQNSFSGKQKGLQNE